MSGNECSDNGESGGMGELENHKETGPDSESSTDITWSNRDAILGPQQWKAKASYPIGNGAGHSLKIEI